MCDALVWSFHAITSINWLEVIKALAPVATAVIALIALKNWQRQDKAKREAEFLDALIEAAHTYIVEMPKPITFLEMAKIGMESHAPTWENGEQADIAVKGAIAYIQKNGEDCAKRFQEILETVRPSVIKLKSLTAKGQVFKFDDYAKCRTAVTMLTWHFGRIEAFMTFIGSPTWAWKNPRVLKHLKDLMAIDPDEIRRSVQECNVAILEFCSETYERIYGGLNWRRFFWKAKARARNTGNA